MPVSQVCHHELPTEDVVHRYATIDIETTGINPHNSQVVAVGLGTYDALTEQQSVDVLTYGGGGGSERALIRRAFARINEFEPEALVTYNGTSFDLDYLNGRIDRLGFDQPPVVECASHHVDLFLPRKRRASELNVKWPSLEEVLDAYGMSVEETEWEGQPLTNTRFGESLAPEYLEAVDNGRQARMDELERVIYEYTVADVEANIAIYEADAGRSITPSIES